MYNVYVYVCSNKQNQLKIKLNCDLILLKKSKSLGLPVQNFGSSLASPQSSFPSQYLSSGRQNVLPLQENSDILQASIRIPITISTTTIYDHRVPTNRFFCFSI